MVHNYQENCILEFSSATDSRSDFFTFFLQRMSDCGVDLYGDGEARGNPLQNFFRMLFHNYQEKYILECSSATDTRSDF